MNVLILYLSITVAGYFIGAFLTKKGVALKGMSIVQTVAVTALVFLMGSRIGADRSIVKSLDSIGIAAFVMTLFILAGSVLAVFGARKLLGFDKKGNLVKFAGAAGEAQDAKQAHTDSSAPFSDESFAMPQDAKRAANAETAKQALTGSDVLPQESCASKSRGNIFTSASSVRRTLVRNESFAGVANENFTAVPNEGLANTSGGHFAKEPQESPASVPIPEESDTAGTDHTMTICIAVSVVAGILAGYFIIPEGFAELSGNLIVVGLSLLLLFVGMDIGVEGTIVTNFKRAGWRVIVFPFVIMIGTYVGAAAAAVVLPVTVKDALCVGSGFGWYTLAPAMLAEYSMEISAMSFMHNVMRELIGILLMPMIAAKAGYIETISLPGSSSMDVCLPIVERVTRSDIAVYSFISGAVLSASTPVMVSFMMGL